MGNISLGIDIGGTKLALALISENGKVVNSFIVYDHIHMSEIEVVEYCYNLAGKLCKDIDLSLGEIQAIGVGFPGYVQFKTGITLKTTNLEGYKNFPLKETFEKYFRRKVLVDNDANAQAFAELKYGAGRGFSDMIFVTISTGIGSGIIINNSVYRGITGTAGEIGHMIVNMKDEMESKCKCRNNGCLMSYASGLALPHMAKKYYKTFKSNFFTEEDIKSESIDGKVLKCGYEHGDELCVELISHYADNISVGLYNIFQIFNPPLIILGGGLMKFGDKFLNQIKCKVRVLAKDMMFEDMKIKLSELDSNAGVIGAAAIAKTI
ncbi:MAG: ROK family protein [bacterium]|nr:ROK family protein [bacterium]